MADGSPLPAYFTYANFNLDVQTADQTIQNREEIEIVADSTDPRWSATQEISDSFFITFYSHTGFTMADRVYLKNGDYAFFQTTPITLSPAVTSIEFDYASSG